MTARHNQSRLLRRVAAALSGAAVAASLGAVAYAGRALFVTPSARVPTYEVAKVDFVHEVSAEGNLRAVRSIPLAVPSGSSGGPLKIAWTVPDGAVVKQGDVVVRFEPTEFEKRLLDGRDDRATAEAKLEKERELILAASRGRERSAALSQLELEKAREFQAKDPEIFSRNQIIESGIDEELGAARLEHARAAKSIEASLSKKRVAEVMVERRRAELLIEQAERGLRSLELSAPRDGTLLFSRDWRGNVLRVGDSAWPGSTLASIPLPEQMEAEVFVLEADAGGLAVGKPARVVIDAQPEVTHAATITRIDTLAKQPIREVPTRYFGVVLSFERTDTAVMKPGARVRATLVLDRREALVVPRHAVFEKDGEVRVYRQSGDRFEPVPVKLGASTPGRVVIDAGLAAGDHIALVDPARERAKAAAAQQKPGSEKP